MQTSEKITQLFLGNLIHLTRRQQDFEGEITSSETRKNAFFINNTSQIRIQRIKNLRFKKN